MLFRSRNPDAFIHAGQVGLRSRCRTSSFNGWPPSGTENSPDHAVSGTEQRNLCKSTFLRRSTPKFARIHAKLQTFSRGWRVLFADSPEITKTVLRIPPSFCPAISSGSAYFTVQVLISTGFLPKTANDAGVPSPQDASKHRLIPVSDLFRSAFQWPHRNLLTV